MRKFPFLCLFLTVCICLTGCGAPEMIESTLPPLPTSEAVHKATPVPLDETAIWNVASCNNFTLKMLKNGYEEKNLIVSGASMATMLFLLRYAADEPTADTMDMAMERSFDSPVLIQPSAARILSQYRDNSDIEGNFLAQNILFGEGPTLMVNYLDSWSAYSDIQARLTNFSFNQDVELVNDWFAEKTSGALTKAVQVSTENPNTILLEALGVRIQWKTGFDTENTRKKPFNMAGGSSTSASMMNARVPVLYYNDNTVTVSILEAEEDRQVWLLLPGEAYDLHSLLNVLSVDTLQTWKAGCTEKQCNLTMPILRFTHLEDQDAELKKAGMTNLFIEGNAAYPKLGQHVSLTHVRQFLSLQINESGTVISSETGGSHALSPLPNEVPNLTLDRPYLLLVTDKTDDGILIAAAIANTRELQ